MAATQTVAQLPSLRKSAQGSSKLEPRHGVITLSGYGIVVRVDRGHLILEDGIGADRQFLSLAASRSRAQEARRNRLGWRGLTRGPALARGSKRVIRHVGSRRIGNCNHWTGALF